MNVFDQILLILLSIFSVRDLLAKNIDIPKNKKWSWLFYNNKEINQVPSCYQLSNIEKKVENAKNILQLIKSKKKFDTSMVI